MYTTSERSEGEFIVCISPHRSCYLALFYFTYWPLTWWFIKPSALWVVSRLMLHSDLTDHMTSVCWTHVGAVRLETVLWKPQFVLCFYHFIKLSRDASGRYCAHILVLIPQIPWYCVQCMKLKIAIRRQLVSSCCQFWFSCQADHGPSLDPDAVPYRPGPTVNTLLKYFKFWWV